MIRRYVSNRFRGVVAIFWKTVADSAALRARTRELNAELERDLSQMLAASVITPKPAIRDQVKTGHLLSFGGRG